MRNAVSINKARTLMAGKIAGLSVLAASAMVFVTPLISLANPSMCGLPNVKATFQQPILGFTFDVSTQTYTFIPAPKNTPIMLGSYIEVKLDSGKLMPGTVRSISKGTIKGFLDPHAPKDGGATKNGTAAEKNAAWDAATVSIAGITTPDNTALDKAIEVTMAKPIVGFALQSDGTFTFKEAPKDTPIMPGSWIEVTTADGKTLPATIASKISPDKKDPTKSTATGYIAALDKTQATKVNISLTTEQSTGSWG